MTMVNKKKYKIGYTAGVYDMFHIGHLNILRRAKELCETLIVGVTSDELCYNRKKKYPIINEVERCEIISSIKYTDYVILQTNMDKLSVVKKYNVDVVFVGSDWKGTPSWIKYEEEFHAVGCDVVYIKHTDGISSSILRDKLNSNE